jgi:hypothetical protein
VSLAEIQPILNVDIFHVEKAAAEIVQEVVGVGWKHAGLGAAPHMGTNGREANRARRGR